MKMKKGLIIVTCISSLVLGGCTMNMQAEDIMSAPKITVTQENIQSIIKENLGENIKLLKPKNINSPIKFIDIDNDGQDEIVVFYASENESNLLRIAMFDYVEDELRVYNTIKANGFDFDKVFFKDIDGDKNLEIILGYETENYMPKGLNIYKYKEDNLLEIFSETYDQMISYDLDSDNIDEILLTKRDEEKVIANLNLYKYKEGKMVKVDEKEIDYGGVISLKAGFASRDIMGVFVDSVVGAHSGSTNMFIYKDGGLVDPFEDNPDRWNLFFSPYAVISKDIDGDGIIEVANLFPLKGYENEAMAGMIFKTMWSKWDEKDGVKFVMDSLYNVRGEYEILFPEGLNENITLSRDINDNKYSDVIEYVNGDKKEEVLEILTIVGKENTEELGIEYKHLKNYKDMIYFVRIINEELYEELDFENILNNNFITG